MQPLVSIIMDSYNHEAFIAEAIESVLDQSYSNFEFLISDDCSTDNTAEVIRQYTDERIKPWYHNENLGAAGWNNSLFLYTKVKGKYIAVLHSDDVWLPGKLEKQVKYMESHPEYAACFTHAELIDENSERNADLDMAGDIFLQPNRSQAQWLKHFFLNGNCLCHPSVLAKSEVYLGLNKNLALRQLPDFAMWIELVKEHPIHIIRETLTLHRRLIATKGNVSSSGLTDNMVRLYEEACFLAETYFENIPVELFIEAFSELFRDPQASSTEELICEKFFLLLDHWHIGGYVRKLSAAAFFFRYCGNEEILKIMEYSYGYLLSDFYSFTGSIDLDWLKEDPSTSEYHGTVFFDTGLGFSASEMDAFTFSGRENSINWNGLLPQGCKAVRLDPVENFYCSIHTLKIVAGTTEISPNFINGVNLGELVFFDTTDPQILIELPDEYSGYLHIEMTVLPFRETETLPFARETQLLAERGRALSTQLDNTIAELAQNEADLSATKQDLQSVMDNNTELGRKLTQNEADLSATKQDLQNVVSSNRQLGERAVMAETAYAEIANSFFWKLTKPARSLVSFFKTLSLH